jgi:hypothetical protein
VVYYGGTLIFKIVSDVLQYVALRCHGGILGFCCGTYLSLTIKRITQRGQAIIFMRFCIYGFSSTKICYRLNTCLSSSSVITQSVLRNIDTNVLESNWDVITMVRLIVFSQFVSKKTTTRRQSPHQIDPMAWFEFLEIFSTSLNISYKHITARAGEIFKEEYLKTWENWVERIKFCIKIEDTLLNMN